ncbi:RNA-directed DNA polymerase from mobile element jockey-like [Brachionus plicatilis]|uniref:RNA-directed DNA polymerase from mobile element jockey-like n=1 Tax=Brachionus plicatilis TaxID=10195 RepID=A0A3M7TA95_BRAPC|nr:RNA-directed DNA polymerase from mobile element jockey-like [Brachionus plicatilis]
MNSTSLALVKIFMLVALHHGYLPDSFNVSIVNPIPKGGVTNEPSDFRPISVSNSFATILEVLLLGKMDCFNQIHVNQFGYKRNLSCKHAYFIVNETINYYRQNGSKLHVVFLDASKAFDKLLRDGLFLKLINRIPDELRRILYKYYRISKIIVKYDNELGDMLESTEGVKQGGILSPYLLIFSSTNY